MDTMMPPLYDSIPTVKDSTCPVWWAVVDGLDHGLFNFSHGCVHWPGKQWCSFGLYLLWTLPSSTARAL
jgi:hypothetical protein